jgi:hypothetical protein
MDFFGLLGLLKRVEKSAATALVARRVAMRVAPFLQTETSTMAVSFDLASGPGGIDRLVRRRAQIEPPWLYRLPHNNLSLAFSSF